MSEFNPLRLSQGDPEVGLRIVKGTQLFFSEINPQTEKFFIGQDIHFTAIDCKDTHCVGNSTVPSDYFGVKFNSSDDLLSFILYLRQKIIRHAAS